MQTTLGVVASLPVAGHTAIGIRDSFAEVMRQSSQPDVAKPEAKTPVVKDVIPGSVEAKKDLAEVTRQPAQVGAAQTEAKAASLSKTPAMTPLNQGRNQLSSGVKDEVDASDGEESEIPAEDAAKPETKALAKSADAATKSEATKTETVVAPAASAAPVKAPVKAVSAPILVKLPIEQGEKAKTAVTAKTSAHLIARNSQSPSVPAADDNGTVVAAPTANVVVQNVATDSAKQITAASFAATASSAPTAVAAEEKVTKGKTSQTASTAGPETASTTSFADAVAVASVSAVSGGIVAGSLTAPGGAVATIAVQSSVGQMAGAMLGQVHTAQGQGVNPLPASAAHSVQTGKTDTAALPGQSSGPGDLMLSTYDTGKPNQLEVGLQSGGFGWLKVRAELASNGEVNAYLRGSSPDSTGLLQMQVPKIEAYLGTQDVAVRSVQVETARTHAPATGLGGDGGVTADSGASQQQSGRGNRNPVAGMETHTSVDAIDEGAMPARIVISQGGIAITGTGNWLSVRA